ncbi:MAG: glycosyltransferase family 39 protein [Anaerolineae bacterium]
MISKNSPILKTEFVILIGLLVVILLPRAFPFPTEFISNDEPVIWQWSNKFAKAVLDGNWQDTLNNAYPAVPLMWLDTTRLFGKYLFLSVSDPARITITDVFNESLSTTVMVERRLLLAFVHTGLLLVLYRLLLKLLNRSVALTAVVLIALDPFLLFQSRVVRVEVLAGELMLLSLITMLIYLQKKPKKYWLLVSAGLASLAILTKITALFLAPFLALLLIWGQVFEVRRSWQSRFLQNIKNFLFWTLIAMTGVFLLWPVLWVNPNHAWNFIREYLTRASTGRGIYLESGVFFLGQMVKGDPGFWFYPLTLLFRVTPLVWLGLITWLGWQVVDWRRGNTLSEINLSRRIPSLSLISPVIIFVLFALGYTVSLTVGLSKFEHYLIPVFLMLNIIASAGLEKLGRFISRWFRSNFLLKQSLGQVYGGIAVVLGIQLYTILPYAPYYITYWNPILGGLKQAVKVLPLLGWGEGVDLAITYLNSQPNAADLTLVCGGQKWELCNLLFKGTSWAGDAYSNNSGRWVGADYIFIYLPAIQANLYPTYLLNYLQRHSAAYTVTFDGLEYAWLYRGPKVAHQSGKSLGNGGVLLGYNITSDTAQAGQPVKLELIWQNATKPRVNNLKISLIDDDGYVWAMTTVVPQPAFKDGLDIPEAIIEMTGTLDIPTFTPPGTYHLQFILDKTSGGETPDRFIDKNVLVIQKANFTTYHLNLPVQSTMNKSLGDSHLELAGLTLNRHSEFDNKLWLELWWQAQAEVQQDYALKIELLNQAGEPVYYQLAPPLQGKYWTSNWHKGDVFLDPWLLNLYRPLSAGKYNLHLTLVEVKTGRAVANVWNSIKIEKTKPLTTLCSMDQQSQITFGKAFYLAGYDLYINPTDTSIYVDLNLCWYVGDRLNPSQAVVQLVDATGKIVVQNTFLMSLNQLGQTDFVMSHHQLQINKAQFNSHKLAEYKLQIVPQSVNHQQASESEYSAYIIDNPLQKAVVITQ